MTGILSILSSNKTNQATIDWLNQGDHSPPIQLRVALTGLLMNRLVLDAATLFAARMIQLFAYGALSVGLVLYLAELGLSEALIGGAHRDADRRRCDFGDDYDGGSAGTAADAAARGATDGLGRTGVFADSATRVVDSGRHYWRHQSQRQ